MNKNYQYRKLKYKGEIIYLMESNYKMLTGVRNKINGMLFISINKNLRADERNREFHRLLKNKNPRDIYGKRVRYA